MSKELLTLTVSHAVDGRRPIPLQLKVHRPEHFGGVSISFLEPCGARISILQDLKNLLARPSDRVTPFTQGRHFQHNTLVMVWRTLRIRSTRRKQYAREYGSSNQSLAQHKKLASFPPAFYTISRGLGKRLAEKTPVFCAAPTIDCCCRTLVRIVCAESILFGAYAKP